MIALALLAILILVSWLRIARPGGQRLQGMVIHDARLPLLARLRMQAIPAVVAIGAAVLMWLLWSLPAWGIGAAAGAIALLVAVPMRYTLTTVGIRAGWTPLRRWTEFAGVARAPGGARLQGAAGRSSMRIWLSGTLGDDEFVLLLRRMITGAYKGQNLSQNVSAVRPDEQSGRQAAAVDVTCKPA